jgi:CBS domain-containing protein
MRLAEIMTRAVITTSPETSVRDAARLLSEHAIASLPVVDEDGELVGIVSEADLLRGRLPDDPRTHLLPISQGPDPSHAVASVLTPTVICLGPDADTADAAAAMLESNVRAMPVVDGGRVIGIVSRRDLLRTLVRGDEAVRADVQERLDAYAGEPDRWRAEVDDGVVTIRGHPGDDREADVLSALARTVPGALRVHVHRTHWPTHG